ncbi:hypothetical protein Tco_0969025 [Tanacetum coccineum]
MEEYIRLEEEKARRHGKVFNCETAKYGKIWDDEDVHNLRSVDTEFPAIVFDDAFKSEVTHSCEPTVSPLNDHKLDFRVSFDDSDDEDYTVIFDKNSFSYKKISTNDLKTDSENDNEKVNMPSFPSPEPTTVYTAYPNLMDTAYRLSGRYPVFIFSTVYTEYSLNEYSIFDTGPRERKSTNVGGEFINLEILKYWSLETSRRLFNTQSCS